MTREEQLKYCRCCKFRQNTSDKGVICSLTGAIATFEDGCKDFEEDPVAMKELFYKDDEKKDSRFVSIETLIVGLAVCSYLIPYFFSMMNKVYGGNDGLTMQLYYVSGVFAVLGLCWIAALYLYRKTRTIEKKQLSVLNAKDMISAIREEGLFPFLDADGDITLKRNGITINIGECASGFVYTRIYYRLRQTDVEAAMYAANEVDASFVAIKTLVIPAKEQLIFSVESYCKDKEEFKEFFNRSMSILADGIDKFNDEMDTFHRMEESRSLSVEEQSNCYQMSKLLS